MQPPTRQGSITPKWYDKKISVSNKEFLCSTLDKAEKVGIIELDALASSLFRPRRFALPRAAGFFVSVRWNPARAPWSAALYLCHVDHGYPQYRSSVVSVQRADAVASDFLRGRALLPWRLHALACSRLRVNGCHHRWRFGKDRCARAAGPGAGICVRCCLFPASDRNPHIPGISNHGVLELGYVGSRLVGRGARGRNRGRHLRRPCGASYMKTVDLHRSSPLLRRRRLPLNSIAFAQDHARHVDDFLSVSAEVRNAVEDGR